MKKLAIFLICTLLLVSLPAQNVSAFPAGSDIAGSLQKPASGRTTKILLIGNSFTLCNHLNQILENLSKDAGRTVKVTTVAKGGASLEQYASKNTPEGKIVHRLLTGQKWDYVVLQDRHFYPLTNPDKMTKSVLSLKPYIKKSGARLALYMTWAPGKGHRDYSLYHYFVANRKDYQMKIAKAYTDAAKASNALLIPVGYAFYREHLQKSSVRLLRPDKYHPNYAGSYLAACTIYSSIFQEAPNSSFYGELRGSTARHLQRIAYRTVRKGSPYK